MHTTGIFSLDGSPKVQECLNGASTLVHGVKRFKPETAIVQVQRGCDNGSLKGSGDLVSKVISRL